jgi:hypothetical protein
MVFQPGFQITTIFDFVRVNTYTPTTASEDYKLFPVVGVVKEGLLIPRNSTIEYYHVYLALTYSNKTTKKVDMAPCLSLPNQKFQPGGFYYDTVDVMFGDKNLYCPTQGDIDFNGFAGTNLFIIPKNTTDTAVVDALNNNMAIITIMSEHFQIYNETANVPFPFTPKFDEAVWTTPSLASLNKAVPGSELKTEDVIVKVET